MHKTLGIVVTAIAAVQFVLGALCRPKPDAGTRKTWNFAHHWLGRTAVICAWCAAAACRIRLAQNHLSARRNCVLRNVCAAG